MLLIAVEQVMDLTRSKIDQVLTIQMMLLQLIHTQPNP
jgi:hypothetical protein